MNRRSFLAALSLAVPAIAAPKRVYSFLWDNPLVESVYEYRLRTYPQFVFPNPSEQLVALNPVDYAALEAELRNPQKHPLLRHLVPDHLIPQGFAQPFPPDFRLPR